MNINEFLSKYGNRTASLIILNAAHYPDVNNSAQLQELAEDLQSALESYQKRVAELTKV